MRKEYDAKFFWSTGPEEIETLPPVEHGYTLLEIEEKDLNTVTRLVIENGVTSIGDYAFAGMWDLILNSH